MTKKEEITIEPLRASDYHDLSVMVGELLHEIMQKTGMQAFNYDQAATEQRAKNLVADEKYWVFLARDHRSQANAGFVSVYESYALYAGGAFGTIPELYVRTPYRSRQVGQLLLNQVKQFALDKGWRRLEVTTPPLPEFDRTLNFYQKNDFEISGGRKLKLTIPGA